MRFVKIMFVIVILALTGCACLYGDRGIIQNRDTDYLKAYSIPPLQIPCGLSSSTIQAHYPVSDACFPNGGKCVNLTPPELYNTCMPPKQEPVSSGTMARYSHATIQPDCRTALATPRYYFDPFTRTSKVSRAGIRPDALARAVIPIRTKQTYSASAKQTTPSSVEQNTQIAENNATSLSEEQHQIQQHYYDRFSHR